MHGSTGRILIIIVENIHAMSEKNKKGEDAAYQQKAKQEPTITVTRFSQVSNSSGLQTVQEFNNSSSPALHNYSFNRKVLSGSHLSSNQSSKVLTSHDSYYTARDTENEDTSNNPGRVRYETHLSYPQEEEMLAVPEDSKEESSFNRLSLQKEDQRQQSKLLLQ